jgi:hypothetical protein
VSEANRGPRLVATIPISFTPKNPRLTGFDIEYEDGKTVPHIFRINMLEVEVWRACIAWHRTAFLPLLPDDCCYGPGELPRLMQPDEVRFPDGSAGRMEWCRDNRIEVGAFHWWPGRDCRLKPNHPALVDGQLARLQSFWDANQPKEADPPVELAEDVAKFSSGQRYRMIIDGGRLKLSGFDCDYQHSYDRPELDRAAQQFPNPLGWPRALAYFDRHVKREPTFARCPTCGQPGDAGHCPARVTDVQFDRGVVTFRESGLVITEKAQCQSEASSMSKSQKNPQETGSLQAKSGSTSQTPGGEPEAAPSPASSARSLESARTTPSSNDEHSASNPRGRDTTDVTPSGEVKAPTRDELRAEIAQCAKELEAATRRAGESGASSICVSWPGETVVDLTELREALDGFDKGASSWSVVEVARKLCAVERLVGK